MLIISDVGDKGGQLLLGLAGRGGGGGESIEDQIWDNSLDSQKCNVLCKFSKLSKFYCQICNIKK